MRKLLVHASGFAKPAFFTTDLVEVGCGYSGSGGNAGCHWSPSSEDFAAMGNNSNGSEPASDLDELLQVLERQPKGSLGELRIIGHSSTEAFALAGTITQNDVAFSTPSCFSPRAPFTSRMTKFQRLADRFARGSSVTLFGCNSAGGTKHMLNLVSKAFLLPIHGFVELIDYEKSIIRPQKDKFEFKELKLGERGRVRYTPSKSESERPWKKNCWEIYPDGNESSMLKRTFAKAKAGSRHGFSVGAGAAIIWAMIREFFPEDSHLVHGTGYYPATELSLSTAIKGSKNSIEVSQGFINELSPETLHWRLRELRIALDNLLTGTKVTIALQK